MGWFRSEKRANLALERLENALAELKSDVQTLQAGSKRLELEWSELYDKVRHQMSRMARRGDLPPAGNGEEITPPDGDGEPQMDPISAGIHARRNKSFLGR